MEARTCASVMQSVTQGFDNFAKRMAAYHRHAMSAWTICSVNSLLLSIAMTKSLVVRIKQCSTNLPTQRLTLFAAASCVRTNRGKLLTAMVFCRDGLQ